MKGEMALADCCLVMFYLCQSKKEDENVNEAESLRIDSHKEAEDGRYFGMWWCILGIPLAFVCL